MLNFLNLPTFNVSLSKKGRTLCFATCRIEEIVDKAVSFFISPNFGYELPSSGEQRDAYVPCWRLNTINKVIKNIFNLPTYGTVRVVFYNLRDRDKKRYDTY